MKEINSKEKKEINGGKMSSLMKRKRSPHVSFHYLVAIICFPSSGTPFLSLSFACQSKIVRIRAHAKGERKAFTISLKLGHIFFSFGRANAHVPQHAFKCSSVMKRSAHREG
jgi:hypothetical protein